MNREDWVAQARAVPIEKILEARGHHLRRVGTELIGPCPLCGGSDRFSVNPKKQVWNCRGCAVGGDNIALVKHLDGSEFDAAVTAIAGERPNGRANGEWHPVASYHYLDAEFGEHLRVDRLEGPATGPGKPRKSFPQAWWVKGHGWVNRKPAGFLAIPYRLPELLDSDRSEPVWIPEGEKCVDATRSLGAAATCNPGGAGKWTPELNEYFRDRIVALPPDNDAPGLEHVRKVASSLYGIAREIRIVTLPGLGDKEDIADLIERGGTRDQLDKLFDWAPIYEPPAGVYQEPAGGLREAPARAKRVHWRTGEIVPRDLCDERFEPLRYVVPDLIPEGVTLLVGRPKLGKSWFILQVCTAVATGVVTLTSGTPVPSGDVLSLALEDNKRRLQRRMRKFFGMNRECWPERLALFTAWRRLDEGGLEDLREWCASVDKPTLIAIDTLKRVRKPKGHNQTDYDADYEACQGLIELAKEFPGLSIMVAHHDRKMGADDIFDTVSGTLGLTGGVDTIAIITGKEGRPDTLHVEGRDLVETVKKAIRFDTETCRFSILGEAVEVQRSANRSRVLTALRNAPEGMSVTELMSLAGLAGQNAAYLLLGRMTEEGDIERVRKGIYGLPGTRANLSLRKVRQVDRQMVKPLEPH